MTAFIKKMRSKFAISNKHTSTKGTMPAPLTDTQKSFLLWNAERLGISLEESQQRYFTSWSAIREGHAGSDFRSFCSQSYDLFQVFFSDTGGEIYTAYQSHGPLHFLRMLSYPEPPWNSGDMIIEHLGKYSAVDIIDYGCGLAQSSRSLASYLQGKGITARLILVDIPTIRKDFLLWLGTQSDIETKFLDCSITSPIPNLPDCDICFATEFFEHVREPLQYFDHIHDALRKNGLLVTNISDHRDGFMHVSPNLQALRSRIQSLPYDELRANRIFRKNSNCGSPEKVNEQGKRTWTEPRHFE